MPVGATSAAPEGIVHPDVTARGRIVDPGATDPDPHRAVAVADRVVISDPDPGARGAAAKDSSGIRHSSRNAITIAAIFGGTAPPSRWCRWTSSSGLTRRA